MECELELTIILSNDIYEKVFLEILSKLKKSEYFVSSTYSANRLYITFSGNRELSKFILGVINELKGFLREYKLGIRDFYVPSYEISFPCEFFGKVEIPITKTVICNGKTCRIVFADLEKEFLRNGLVERAMNLIKNISKKEEKLIFKQDSNAIPYQEKIQEEIKQEIKKGIIKEKNIYLPTCAEKISKIKEEIIENLKKEFKAQEIFVPLFIPINLLESRGISALIPKEAFSNFVSKPVNLKKLYEIYYLTEKIPKTEIKNIGLLYNEIPLTLYKALENTTAKKQFFYYLNYIKLNFAFFDTLENYENTKEKIIGFFKNILNIFGLEYMIVMKKICGKEFFKFEGLNKKHSSLVEIFFSEEAYTKLFKIKGKSGHGVINLENLLLNKIF